MEVPLEVVALLEVEELVDGFNLGVYRRYTVYKPLIVNFKRWSEIGEKNNIITSWVLTVFNGVYFN